MPIAEGIVTLTPASSVTVTLLSAVAILATSSSMAPMMAIAVIAPSLSYVLSYVLS